MALCLVPFSAVVSLSIMLQSQREQQLILVLSGKKKNVKHTDQYHVVGSWRAASGGVKGAHIGLCLIHSLVELSAKVGRPPTAIRLQITDQTTPNVVVQLFLIYGRMQKRA